MMAQGRRSRNVLAGAGGEYEKCRPRQEKRICSVALEVGELQNKEEGGSGLALRNF